MAVYLVSGRLGSGKTLASVGRIRDALLDGKPVATNLDLKLEKLLPIHRRDVTAYRLPDQPTVEDFERLGKGNPGYDESQNGLIVLDELATWLNARSWSDKTRGPFLDWVVHSRKHGWDMIFIAQHIDQIDKQLRVSVIEYAATCRRLDRMAVPFLSPLVRLLTLGFVSLKLPKLHVATVRYGTDSNSPVAERWVYQGGELYESYDTRQVFSPTYPHALYTYLSPWHLAGRYTPPSFLQRVMARIKGRDIQYEPATPRVVTRRSEPEVEWVRSLPANKQDLAVAALRKRGLLSDWRGAAAQRRPPA